MSDVRDDVNDDVNDDAGADVGDGRSPAGRGIGVVAAVVVTVVAFLGLSWRAGRPALWLDETASVVATQRHWPALFRLLHDADAPLVPYYALLKVASGATTWIWPGAARHPELLYRWPSLLVSALAVGLFTWWLSRRAGLGTALASSAVLLLCSSLSFYAQDARPYAFALAAAVAASAAWTRLVDDPRPRWVVVYAVCVAVLVDAHLLAGTLLVAHLVAAVVRPAPAHRWRGVRAMVVGGVLGLAVGAPFAVFAALHGRGVRDKAGNVTTPHKLLDTFAQLFTVGHSHRLGMVAILLLALVGLARFRSARVGALARLAGCWAVIPVVLLAPVFVTHPGLLQVRYVLFALPGWALLAGIGLVTVAEAVARPVGRRALVAVAAGAVVVAAIASQQRYGAVAVRSPGGHGEDIRPGLALAAAPAHADLPIVLSLRSTALEIAAYAPQDLPRVYGLEVQRTRPAIWPASAAAGPLGDRVILMLRTGSLPGNCPRDLDAPLAPQVTQCLTRPLLPDQDHYRVASAVPAGTDWTFVILAR